MSEIKVTQFKTKRINERTGGKIADYKMEDGFVLENSFLSVNGEYLGDYATGWRYVKDNLRVPTKGRKHGVAEIINPKTGIVIGYRGFSHRGFSDFKVGDKLFTTNYTPKRSHFTTRSWCKFQKDREKAIKRDMKDWECSRKKAAKMNPIKSFIPYKHWGIKRIKRMVQAREAATRFMKYVS